MAGHGPTAARVRAAVITGIWMLVSASEPPVARADRAAADVVAVRHRIQLPDGS